MDDKMRLPITDKTGTEDLRQEKSCGAVVYRADEGRIRFLLTKSHRGVWGFPKGHMEGDETELETAVREIREETGLTVTFREGFRETDEYLIVRKNAPTVDKHVVFFLASYEAQTPVPQEKEVAEIVLLGYKEAMKRLSFEGTRRVLAAAGAFMRRQGQENV